MNRHIIRPARTIGSQGLNSLASGLIVATLVVLFLYMGREILEPLVIAALLGFILAPLIRRLRGWGLWRVPSVIFTVVFAIAIIATLGSTIVYQVAQLAEELPKYETNLRTKLRALGGGSLMSSSLERASDTLKDLQNEISKPPCQRRRETASASRSKNPSPERARRPPISGAFFAFAFQS